MVKLHPIKYYKKELASVDENERILHFMMQQIANDVSMLHKLLIFYLQAPAEELPPVRSARTAMALMLAQFLAGRLYEAWNLLRERPHAKVYQRYSATLSIEAADALAKIKQYFNQPHNLIEKVRNKLAYHTDIETMRAAYYEHPETEAFVDFAADSVGNTFYQGASTLSAIAVKQLADTKDLATGLDQFMKEVRTVGHWLIDYVQGFMLQFVLQHIDPRWEIVSQAAIEVPGPRLVDFHAPFFCEARAGDIEKDE